MTQPHYSTSAEAETAFYQALSDGDFDRMMSVWADDDDIVCVHPGGPRITGRAQLREAWRNMLGSGNALKVELSQAVIAGSTDVAVHSLFEQISADGGERRSPPIVVTNVYVRNADGWRMIVHHASPAPGQEDFGELAPHTVH